MPPSVAIAWVLVCTAGFLWFYRRDPLARAHARTPRHLPRTVWYWLLSALPVLFLWDLSLVTLHLNLSPVALPDFDPFPDYRATSPIAWLPILLAATLFAPILEEFVFRGWIYTYLEARWSMTAALLASSALFGAVHMTPALFLYFTLWGLIFGAIFLITRSLWAPIAAHAIGNLWSEAMSAPTSTRETLFDPVGGLPSATALLVATTAAGIWIGYRMHRSVPTPGARAAPPPAQHALP